MSEIAESDSRPQGPIINEVLCFIMNKWGCIDVDVLTRLCLVMSDNEIEAAKDIIFSHLHDKNDTTAFKKRRHATKGEGKSKKEKNLGDIFCLLEEKGDKALPDFVAFDLGKLPPITFDSVDVSVLLRKIDNLECSVKLLMDGMNTVTNTNASICDMSKKLDSRVCELESNDKLPKALQEEKVLDADINDCEGIFDNIEPNKLNESHNKSTDNNALECEVCDYKCNTQEVLTNHARGHNLFVCSICDNRHSTEEGCQAHVIKHSGEKPFKCNECVFNCDEEVILEQHKLLHQYEIPDSKSAEAFPPLKSREAVPTEHKPYLCTVCDLRFATQVQCKQHVFTHKPPLAVKPNACYICDEKFATTEDLKMHIGTHSDEKPFKCTDCDFACTAGVELDRHVAVQHNGDVSSSKDGAKLSFADMAKQHLIESLFDRDGWSLPFHKGKPMKPKDMWRPNHVKPRQGHNNRSQAMIGTGRGTNVAIPNRKYQASIFATRYEPSMKAITVKKELETNLSRITGEKHIVTVEKLDARYDHYASFKISSACDNTAVFMNPDVWPTGILVRWWRAKRNANDKNANRNHNNGNRS